MLVMRVFADLAAQLRRAELWVPWIESGVRVLTTIIGAWLFTRIAGHLLRRLRLYVTSVMERRGNGPDPELEKRAATIVAVFRLVIGSIVWAIALVMVLVELGFKIEPLLASLGVAGLAFGLGAQTLIKDWLGGLFLLLEDQIRIGDAATINGFSGTVTEINLRTTLLRAENGAVHIISNGSITVLSNFTREYSYYVFETILAHKADADKALEILEQTGAEIAAEPAFPTLAPIEVMGVDKLGDRGATIRARIKTLPSRQYLVGRELNRRIKQRFDAAGILFPPP
jgi:moderate conductance mechanosensitive channel